MTDQIQMAFIIYICMIYLLCLLLLIMVCCNYPPHLGNIIAGEVYSGDNGIGDDDDDMEGDDDNYNNGPNGNEFP